MSHYKTIRQSRYDRLRDSGFLPKEAHVLSRIPNKVPYIKNIINDRKLVLKKAIKRDRTITKYKIEIEKIYRKKDWSNYGVIASKKVYKLDAKAIYKMLREYEEKYKNEKDNQAYKSPWIKKQKAIQEFESKFEKTYQFHD